jgi:hypothetical protein
VGAPATEDGRRTRWACSAVCARTPPLPSSCPPPSPSPPANLFVSVKAPTRLRLACVCCVRRAGAGRRSSPLLASRSRRVHARSCATGRAPAAPLWSRGSPHAVVRAYVLLWAVSFTWRLAKVLRVQHVQAGEHVLPGLQKAGPVILWYILAMYGMCRMPD